MNWRKAALFIRQLIRLDRMRSEPKTLSDRIDPADMGTAFGLESTMIADDEPPLVRRLSARDRALLHPRHPR